MNTRERLEATIAGTQVDRLPIALWRHWPGDDQRAADLAYATRRYQEQFGWDFIVVVPSSHFSVAGYGVHDGWAGDNFGRRAVNKYPVQRSLHWTELRVQDPTRGALGRQLDALRTLTEALATSTPILQLIYSPLAQAARSTERSLLLRHLRTNPDRLRSGLNTITETTLQFLDMLRRLPIAGIVYVAELACYSELSDDEYAAFGTPYDEKVLTALPSEWWFNLVQVRGHSPMLHHFTHLPIQALGWADQTGHPSLDRVVSNFSGAFYGGLNAEKHLHLGTPPVVRDAVRQAAQATLGRRLIIGTGDLLPLTTPISNLRAALDAAKTTAI